MFVINWYAKDHHSHPQTVLLEAKPMLNIIQSPVFYQAGHFKWFINIASGLAEEIMALHSFCKSMYNSNYLSHREI